MIRKIWYYLFNLKEKDMSVTDENVVAIVSELKAQVDHQQTVIDHLSNRISFLVDEMALVKNDIGNFKTGVSTDLKSIVDAVVDVKANVPGTLNIR